MTEKRTIAGVRPVHSFIDDMHRQQEAANAFAQGAVTALASALAGMPVPAAPPPVQVLEPSPEAFPYFSPRLVYQGNRRQRRKQATQARRGGRQ